MVAIVQARTGSSRLPGKTLKQLGGQSVLARVLERLGQCRHIDQIVVATTVCGADDAICREAESCGVAHFRGREQDVLSRYHQAASRFLATDVVRITSDCPLLDAELVDRMIRRYHELRTGPQPIDYLSNALQRTFPHGHDAEVFTAAALQAAWQAATQAYEREHVTPFIYLHPERFRVYHFGQAEDQSHYRWTLDEPADLEFFKAVFDHFGAGQPTTQQVLQLLDRHPEISQLNAGVRQKKLDDAA